MADVFPPTRQRPAILEFAEAADTRKSALRRDDCGDWRISGKYGCVYAVPVAASPTGVGYQLMFVAIDERTGRAWESAKRRLSFAEVVQNGDAEGGLILSRLPTPPEAKEIRKVLGIPTRRHMPTLLGVKPRFAGRSGALERVSSSGRGSAPLGSSGETVTRGV